MIVAASLEETCVALATTCTALGVGCIAYISIPCLILFYSRKVPLCTFEPVYTAKYPYFSWRITADVLGGVTHVL